MGFKCCGLASGSEGNCLYIESDQAKILIDIGLSFTRLKNVLDQIHKKPDDIDAVVITHEHSDHVKGVGVFARRQSCPLYLSSQTLDSSKMPLAGTEQVNLIENNRSFWIEDMLLEPFSVLHDAVDPIGITITNNNRKIGIATDLGRVTHLVREKLRGSQLLVLEFNHDEEMLMANEVYPWHVKQRIKSSRGHLSNVAASTFLAELVDDSLQVIMLAHLSQENNLGQLARQHVTEVLREKNLPDRKVVILEQDQRSEVIEI